MKNDPVIRARLWASDTFVQIDEFICPNCCMKTAEEPVIRTRLWKFGRASDAFVHSIPQMLNGDARYVLHLKTTLIEHSQNLEEFA